MDAKIGSEKTTQIFRASAYVKGSWLLGERLALRHIVFYWLGMALSLGILFIIPQPLGIIVYGIGIIFFSITLAIVAT